MGLVLGCRFMVAVSWLLRNKAPQRIDKWFRKLQLLSAAATAWDTAATTRRKPWASSPARCTRPAYMTASELAGNWGRFHWPIILAAHAAIAAGNLFRRLAHRAHHGLEDHQAQAGGRILRGNRRRHHAFLDRAGRHSGEHHAHHHRRDCRRRATTRFSAVRWGVARRIVWAWVLTIPASAAVSAAVYWVIQLVKPGA